MNFDKFFPPFFGAGIKRIHSKTATACLCSFIEQGRDYWEKWLQQDGYSFNLECARYLDSVSEVGLTENKVIIESLRIAYTNDFKKANLNETAANEFFLERLQNIFPFGLANKLYTTTVKGINEDRKRGFSELLKTVKDIDLHYENLKQLINDGANESAAQKSKFTKKLAGTPTQIIKCPSGCGREKRCGVETKKYRCPCGFKSPYPFQA